eukprot:COSAG05_NODE_14060_length_409_cov_1.064516_1_plen_49_part_01
MMMMMMITARTYLQPLRLALTQRLQPRPSGRRRRRRRRHRRWCRRRRRG